MQYLDDKYPQHPLLPHDIHKRAINFQVHLHFVSILYRISVSSGPDACLLIMSCHTQAAHIVSSSIQPLQNMGFLVFIVSCISFMKQPFLDARVHVTWLLFFRSAICRITLGKKLALTKNFLGPKV